MAKFRTPGLDHEAVQQEVKKFVDSKAADTLYTDYRDWEATVSLLRCVAETLDVDVQDVHERCGKLSDA